ncbi:peptidoglycan D,D-transpeptidase FtsI family protein [Aquibaculum arenosum]|uniref:Penicillin-binding protein 2 n=1 Tax=Aquibaculum arenosum TaxID=3032591 RepID=A0ABT5YQL0_9PROT|nr:penicillin-binding protein 2 [Fodinicurvata sp. CAU 1616]MDF2097223.1 penicillin-binding protein 2 [Fodinicurvata sp. CAU 1616]
MNEPREPKGRHQGDLPSGMDLGQPERWVVGLDGNRKQALEVGRTRLILTGLLFAFAFLAVGFRLVELSWLQNDMAPRIAGTMEAPGEWQAGRAGILDRNGEVLAANLPTMALYANPRELRDPIEVADRLAEVMPDAIGERLRRDLDSDRSFVWVKRCLSPQESSAVIRLGVPGLHLQRDECRFYPHGELVSHVVGFTDIDDRGLAGMERAFDAWLAGGETPLQLSLDLRVQHVLAEELQAAIDEFSGVGGAAVVMDADNGELLGMVSLPSFDPRMPGRATEEQRFNRAALGVYEVGSVLKSFSTAAALDSGSVTLEDGWDTSQPIRVARFTINDFRGKNRWQSVPEIFQNSSNIGTVHMAMTTGTERLRNYLDDFGLLDPASLELPERGRPMLPNPWREINTMTISYGHGIALTPLQVTRAFAALVNGGELVQPTLIKRLPGEQAPRERVISERTSEQMRWLLRLVVLHGSGGNADAEGYLVGGKTGTANKLSPSGGYQKDKRIASFAGAFPIDDPRYVVFFMVDEPKPTERTYGFATAGWVAAPGVGRVISRLGPMLGMPPRPQAEEQRPDPLLVPARLRGRSVASR